MQDKIVGDTILFTAYLADSDGTAITDASGVLQVTDATGSLVSNTSVPHVGAGTYKKSLSSVGWNKGPISEYWFFGNSAGTSQSLRQDTYRMVGTETTRPYVAVSQLYRYYENIVDYVDEPLDDYVVEAFNDINSQLESLGVKVPVRPRADGIYDQVLKDWNAYLAIKKIVSSRQASFTREGREPWFAYFDEQIGSIYYGVKNKRYSFDRDISVAESGISIATQSSGSSIAQMETNWRDKTAFQGADFDRQWEVQVLGTGTSGGLTECTFRFSNDSGLSWSGTYTTSFDWQGLGTGVYVRWGRGTSTTATNLMQAGNAWQFKTFPKSQSVGGRRTAISY